MDNKTANRVNRRDFIKAGIGGAAAITASGFLNGCAPAIKRNVKPNLLFIITDQQSIDTIAHLGCPHVQTPAMDLLAQQGTSFDESYTPHPVCLPARASFFTGRMPSETGINTERKRLRPEMPTLGEWVRDQAGYKTIYAGKWHVPEYIPNAHDDIPGFHTIATGIAGQGFMMDTNIGMACDAYIRNYSYSDPLFIVASFMNPHDICEWQFLNTANQDKLLYPEIAGELPEMPANFNYPEGEPEAIKNFRETLDPHVGYWEELQWRYYLWSYYRHVEMLDGEIERLLDALRDTGRDKDTFIIFTSDHGEGLGHHQMTHKLFPYDEVCKVPMIMGLPGSLPEDRVNPSCLVSGVDIMPTFCDFAGISSPAGMKGFSLRKTLEDGTEPDRSFVPVEIWGNIGKMIRSQNYKYVKYEDDPAEMLFDMVKDSGESDNVAKDAGYTSVLEEHREMLKDWMAGLDFAEG